MNKVDVFGSQDDLYNKTMEYSDHDSLISNGDVSTFKHPDLRRPQTQTTLHKTTTPLKMAAAVTVAGEENSYDSENDITFYRSAEQSDSNNKSKTNTVATSSSQQQQDNHDKTRNISLFSSSSSHGTSDKKPSENVMPSLNPANVPVCKAQTYVERWAEQNRKTLETASNDPGTNTKQTGNTSPSESLDVLKQVLSANQNAEEAGTTNNAQLVNQPSLDVINAKVVGNSTKDDATSRPDEESLNFDTACNVSATSAIRSMEDLRGLGKDDDDENVDNDQTREPHTEKILTGNPPPEDEEKESKTVVSLEVRENIMINGDESSNRPLDDGPAKETNAGDLGAQGSTMDTAGDDEKQNRELSPVVKTANFWQRMFCTGGKRLRAIRKAPKSRGR